MEERRGEAASLREAPPPEPLSRRAAGNKLVFSLELSAHASWARFLMGGSRSRRLTEPPRPASLRGTERCRGYSQLRVRRRAPPRTVAAALSAAVISTKQQETAPTSQAEPSQQNRTSRTPHALRERGSGGEALLSRSGLSPRISYTSSLREGARGRGLLVKEAPSLAVTHPLKSLTIWWV